MLSEHRHALHRIPELGWELPKTAEYLKTQLGKLPCTVFSPVGTAVCAYFDLGKAETVAFRSDMDALPIMEETGLPYASTHAGKMHACGHDGHMSILLGLAEYVAAHPEVPSRNVLLIFEPAEETNGGALSICETGLFDTYRVTRVFGLHLWPELPKHAVAACEGPMMARSSELTVEVTGTSVHIAKWREGRDALAAAAEFLTRAEALGERQPCVLRFGKLESGEVRNAVARFARLEGSLRAFDDGLFLRLWGQLKDLAAEISEKTGCTLTPSITDGYPPVTNDAALLAEVRSRYPVGKAEPSYTTEDFSEYQRRAPGVFFFLGTGGKPVHSPYFDFDERVLETGLALFRTLL